MKMSLPHIHVWNKARQAGKMDLDESLNLDLFSLVHKFYYFVTVSLQAGKCQHSVGGIFCFSDMAWMKLKKKNLVGQKLGVRC